ncbi:MAG: hypothetical protein KIT58_02575 [Planctomycetota bacterium]|nr:hypothetical protein [Planctomycetota bacterium]
MSGPGPWIVSPRFDLALLAAPAAATAVALLLPATDGVPLWAFLLLVVAFDVAHVWSTLYLSYLDREAMARRRLLFLLPVPLSLLVAYRLHAHSPVLFWTLLAYVAIHHFAAQQWGFIALYKLRAGERDPVDRYLDKWTLWVGALGPVLWWHASPGRRFDWFGHGEEFLFALDPGLRPDIAVVMGAFAAVWVARQTWHLAWGRLCVGKALWMVAAWLSWSLGIGLADHPLVSLAAINLLHGVPFLGLVWFRCNRRWEGRTDAAPSPLLARLSQRRALWAFYGLIVLLALLEEGLWDGALWGVYLAGLTGLEPPALSDAGRSLLVAALATPQIVHYYLDAWLWKLDGSNPDLHEALGVPHRG